MRHRRRTWIVALRLVAFLVAVAIVSACVARQPGGDTVVVRLTGDTIEYSGMLSDVSVAKVSALLMNDSGIRWLQIDSDGGDVELGLALGELVRNYRLNVRVVGNGCHSSCANYVFPAGDIKLIGAGALVSWHGSAIQHDWGAQANADPAFASLVDDLRTRQHAYFEGLGLDERITIVGQDLGCDCAWALSVADMARFGLDDVEASPQYPADALATRSDVRVQWLSLPDDVFDRIRPARTEP